MRPCVYLHATFLPQGSAGSTTSGSLRSWTPPSTVRMRDRNPRIAASKRDEGQKRRRSPPAQPRAGNEVTAAVTRRSQPVMFWLTWLQLTQVLLSFLVATHMVCLWTRSTCASLCKDPLCNYLYLCQILPTQAAMGLYPGQAVLENSSRNNSCQVSR